MMVFDTDPVWIERTDLSHLACEAWNTPLPLIYFCRTVTRGSTASAGSLRTVLSMRVMSALSRTLSSILASLEWRPCRCDWSVG